MSRTREIEVWVQESEIFNRDLASAEIRVFTVNHFNYKPLKAKLIIELPSPKITISEEDVDKAFNSIRYLEVHENNLCPYTVRHLRMALFKDAE